MNLKNAKEVKEKVEEVKKKRKPAKAEKVKEVKKETKKQKEKKKKFRRFLLKLFAIEYMTFGMFLLWAFGTTLIQTNEKLTVQLNEQHVIMKNLAEQITELRVKPATIKTIEVVEENEMAYNLTSAERELLAQLLYHEARGESLECQKAVASVILNRVDSKIWGDSLTDVIYAKNQFEPVVKGLLPNTKPLEKQYQAIDYVLENGATVPEEVLYFRADHYFEWATDFMSMDNTYFSF